MKRIIFIVIGLWPSLIVSLSQNINISGTPNKYLRVDSVLEDRVRVTETIAGHLSTFNPGDKVLLIQMTGATIDSSGNYKTFELKSKKSFNHVGRFEILQVDEVFTFGGKTYVVFTDDVLNAYDSGERIQLVRFVEGETVTTSGPVTARDWDGDVGGIVAILGTDSVRLKHNIDVSGYGFSGGSAPVEDYTGGCRYGLSAVVNDTLYFLPSEMNRSGNKGEGIINKTWPFTKGTAFNINGGGAGNGKYSGGGGGSNFNTGGNGGSQATECTSDFPAPGGWGGYACYELYNNQSIPRVIMGGGGGSGTRLTGFTTVSGGDGSGIVIIVTGTLTAEGGSILANGINGTSTYSSGGGGGAGGGILLDATKFTGTFSIGIRGGRGSNTLGAYCTGSGGGGSGGVLLYSGSAISAIVDTAAGVGGTAVCIPQRGSPGGTGTKRSGLISPLNGFLFNSIRGTDTVCAGNIPGIITASQPKGGDGSYLHFWEQSTNNINWLPATGSENTLRTFQPSALSQTTWFRRVVTSNGIFDTSRVVKVFVYPAIGNNNITGTDTLCYNDHAKPITGAAPTGGNGASYTFQWMLKSDSEPWSPSGTLLTTNDPLDPGKLTVSSYFKRIVKSTAYCSHISDSVKITVLPLITDNKFATSDTAICMNQSPGILNALTPGGGDNSFSYAWQYKTYSGSWTPIASSNVEQYTVGTLSDTTLYRRIVYSGNDNACKDTSGARTILVMPLISNNSVLGDPVQYTCYNTPVSLSGSLPDNGFGPGSYAYLWEQSVDNVNWMEAEGITQDYVSSSLIDTRYFRRTVFSTQEFHECADTSDVVEVRINPLPMGDVISSSDTVCAGETLLVNFTVSGNGPFKVAIQGETTQIKSDVIGPVDSIVFVAGATHNYTMFSVEDKNGCLADISGFSNIAHGEVYEVPVAFAGEDADACGNTYTLNAVKSVSGSTGLWSATDATFSNDENTNSSVTAADFGAGIFKWTEINWHCSTSDEVEIIFYEQPQAPDAGPDQLLDFNYTTSLQAVSPSVGIGKWTFESGSGEISNDALPDAVIRELSDAATLKWTVTNGNCPSVSDIMQILVNPLHIKKGFTPNGDTKNDFFDLGAVNAERISLKVFNSSGVLVYESDDYSEEALWDGTNLNGVELPEGTYYYIATIKVAGKSKEVQFRSFVEILR